MSLIYFSPTGTTRTLVEAVARGLDIDTSCIEDLTYERTALQPRSTGPATSPAVIGMPVYAGRLPVLAIERMRRHVRGLGRPAVLVAVYGNRAFEDALLELRDLAEELGFVPVAGGAFIGEHSFSRPELPIAENRPDRADIALALALGQQVRDKLNRAVHPRDLPRLHVPGNFPYREGMLAASISPETQTETCTRCGVCIDVCPPSAITLTTDGTTTDATLCLRCCACIRACPVEARIAPSRVLESGQKLHNLCGHRKEPEFFV